MVAHRKSDQRRDDLCAAGLRTCVLAASHSETFKVNTTAVQRGASIRLRHLQRREQYHAQVRQRAVRHNPLSEETTVDAESRNRRYISQLHFAGTTGCCLNETLDSERRFCVSDRNPIQLAEVMRQGADNLRGFAGVALHCNADANRRLQR